MLESKVQKKVLDWLKQKEGVEAVKTIATNKRGVLDILVAYKGLLIEIELKAPNKCKNLSTLQKRRIAKLTEINTLAFSACSLERVIKAFEAIDKYYSFAFAQIEQAFSQAIEDIRVDYELLGTSD